MGSRGKVTLRIREGKGFKRLISASINGERYSVKVGFIGSGSERRPDGGLTNPMIAATLEFGAPEANIPARPAVAPSWEVNQEKYRKMARKVAEAVSGGSITPEQGLNLIGAQMAADLRDFIVGGPSIKPENAPSVKARKERRSNNTAWGVRTWVDTGELVKSITWIVVKGDGRT